MNNKRIRRHQRTTGSRHDRRQNRTNHYSTNDRGNLVHQHDNERISAGIRELCAAPHADVDHQPSKEEQGNAAEQMSPKRSRFCFSGRRALNRGLVDQHGKNHRADKHHPKLRRNIEKVKLLRRIECVNLRNAALCEH